jgi:hypothetical protein
VELKLDDNLIERLEEYAKDNSYGDIEIVIVYAILKFLRANEYLK